MYNINHIQPENCGAFYPWDEWYDFKPIDEPLIAFYSTFPDVWPRSCGRGWYIIDMQAAKSIGPFFSLWQARGAYSRRYGGNRELKEPKTPA